MPPTLRLLQSPSLQGSDRQVHALQAPAAALLARLAIAGPAARDELAALLYPQAARDRALTNLRQRLHQLREADPGLLQIGRTQVQLGADVRHDLQHPEVALQADPQALAGDLLGTLDFDNTPALADWVRREREAWAERRRDLLARLAIGHEDAGRIALALRYATRLAADAPTHEHGVRLLMRLHYRRGDRGAALAAYERCVEALHRQFGDAVSDETAHLAAAIAQGSDDAPPPLPAMPVGLQHPPVTVGCERELQQALRHWQEAGAVLLTGPPGIGKTRQFEDLCRRTGTTRVLRLAADEAQTPLALLTGLCQLLGAAPPPEATADALRALLADRLAAAGDPLALGVEDLHFADAESLAALATLLPPQGPRQARWCLSSRSQPLPEALGGWLDRQPDLSPMVELREWTEAELARFVASVGSTAMRPDAWARALHRHCGGNPLHVLWMLRALHDEGAWDRPEPPAALPHPAQLRQRIQRRLDACDALAQQLAFVGAIAGVDFDAALVARVTGRRAVELAVPWRRLQALGVLQVHGFSHELVRLAVLDAVPAALRPLLHAEVAQALPDRPAVHERRAAHWAAAGRPLQAAADFASAADHALARGLPVRALDLLRQAQQLHAAHGDAAPAFDLRWRAGRLSIVWDSVDAALSSAESLLADAVDDRQRALALALRSHARAERHEAAALDDATAALPLAAASGDALAGLQARLRHAAALHVVGRPAEALAEADALRATHGSAMADQDRVELEDTRALVLTTLGRRREAVDTWLAERDRALAGGRWQRACELASNASVQLGYLGDLPGALAASEQALELAHRIGADRGTVHVDQMTLAGYYQDAGRFDEALRLGETAAEGLRAAGLGAWILNADNSLASLFMILGRFDLAARRLGEPPADAAPWARAARESLRGMLLARRDGASPREHLERALAIMSRTPSVPFVHHRIAAELAPWLPPDEGLRLLAQAEDWAQAQQHVTLRRMVRRLRVETLLGAGLPVRALAAAEQLQADFGDRWEAMNLYLPDLSRTLVRAYDAAGQTVQADRLAARACAWIDECRPRVPAAFARSFLQDNLTNRWLLQRAGTAHHDGITVDR